MKWAKSKIICPPFFQFNEAANNINDIDAAEDLLYGSLRDHAGCKYKEVSGEWSVVSGGSLIFVDSSSTHFFI